MKIVKRKIADLKFAEYNPRRLTESQAQELRRSLEKFGCVDPVIINVNPERKNVIIGGHQRCRTWAEMGHKDIDCVETHLTYEEERELNIRLNRNTGEFDVALLEKFFKFDELVGWGFEAFELPFRELAEELEKVDAEKEWKDAGMPTFDHQNLSPVRQIIVSFSDDKAVQAFAALTGNTITNKTRSVWYPPQPYSPEADKFYGQTAEEPAEDDEMEDEDEDTFDDEDTFEGDSRG